MKLIKNILRQPVRETLIILGISLVALCVFVLIGMVLGRFTYHDFLPGQQPNYILMLGRMVVSDFAFISKIIFEVACVVLIAQIIYRSARK